MKKFQFDVLRFFILIIFRHLLKHIQNGYLGALKSVITSLAEFSEFKMANQYGRNFGVYKVTDKGSRLIFNYFIGKKFNQKEIHTEKEQEKNENYV